MAAVVRRPIDRGVRAEQHAGGAGLGDQACDDVRAAPRRLEVEIRLLADVPRRSPASFGRAEIRVVHDDRDGRKALRKSADMIRVSFSGGTVACDRASDFLRYGDIRVERAIVSGVTIDGRMEFES